MAGPIRIGPHVTIYPPNPDADGKPRTMHRVVWRRPNGKRRNLWRTDYDDALEAARDLDRQLDVLHNAADAIAERPITRTVAQLADYWLHPNSRPDDPWSVHHTRNCESVVRLWIKPVIGDVPLDQVERPHVIEVLNAVRAHHPKSVRRIGSAMSSMFAVGVEAKWLDRNPAAGIRYNKQASRQGAASVYVPLEKRPDTHAVRQLADVMDRMWPDERLGDAVLLAAFSGLRKAELFALTEHDVEFMDGGARIDVQRQVFTAGGQRHVHLPKYRKLRETFTTDEVADRLADRVSWRLPQAKRYGCTDHDCPDNVDSGRRLLFPTLQAKSWWLSSNFDARRFTPARAEAHWPTDRDGTFMWTWHDLRHHFCTWALASKDAGGRGLEVADVAYFAGHATPEFTFRAYVSARQGAVGRALQC